MVTGFVNVEAIAIGLVNLLRRQDDESWPVTIMHSIVTNYTSILYICLSLFISKYLISGRIKTCTVGNLC